MKKEELHQFIENAERVIQSASGFVEKHNRVHDSLHEETVLINPSKREDAAAIKSMHEYQASREPIAHLIGQIQLFIKKCRGDLKSVLWEGKTFTITHEELQVYKESLEQLQSMFHRQSYQSLSVKRIHSLRKKSNPVKSLTFGQGQQLLNALLKPKVSEDELSDIQGDLSQGMTLTPKAYDEEEDPFAGLSSDEDSFEENSYDEDELNTLRQRAQSLNLDDCHLDGPESSESEPLDMMHALERFKEESKGLFHNQALEDLASRHNLKNKRYSYPF